MTEVTLNTIDEDLIDTVLAPDVEFEGTVKFTKSLMIKGKVSGQIKATGELYIEKEAVVRANIEAQSVQVKGQVAGDIKATSRVDLFASCGLDGDILAPEVTMETGCRFNGICQMTGKK